MNRKNGLKKPRTLEDALQNLGNMVAANPDKKPLYTPEWLKRAYDRNAKK